MECPFCDEAITSRQKVFETKTEYVLYNYAPWIKGQCMVVPKRHVSTVRDLTEQEAQSLFQTVRLASTRLKSHLNPVGFNFGFNESRKAGQTVEHFHFHILPRFTDDKIPQHHIFHRTDKQRKYISDSEIREAVEEFSAIFKK